ncbi:MAG: phosphoenolpyruvate carboxykinase (ATP) [Alphaproteobacteria bacterium]|nr:phosphoenolpyruvate carboxykinase (ATP) [Alphaproteobacteria bacterium]
MNGENDFKELLREQFGLENAAAIHPQLNEQALYELALARKEGVESDDGTLLVTTGDFTGRSANAKFIVEHPGENHIDFGKVNQPCPPDIFDDLWRRAAKSLERRHVFVQKLYAGADPDYSQPVFFAGENAWHALFIRNMLLRAAPGLDAMFREPLRILHVPGFNATPELHGTQDGRFIGADMKTRRVVITGTGYAGEVKKSVFTFMNYLMPGEEVFPMHCAANAGIKKDVALFFGLSGTGKSTLSADPERELIGDDEHGWGPGGVFNFEGGCYPKTINISPETEPQIYTVARSRGTILENVDCFPDSRVPDFFSTRFSKNGRASHQISALDNAVHDGRGGHPENIFLLTCDAFGVLPPISRLSPEQAAHQFLSGYTAKVAGTELGSTGSAEATFSSGFGAPFLPLDPVVYGKMFMEKMREHGPNCWLVNTGYTGTGKRMAISLTRRFVEAALSGELKRVDFAVNNPFGLMVPVRVEGVDPKALDMRSTWDNPVAYEERVGDLTGRFAKNFEKFLPKVPREVQDVARRFGHAPANG